jgi:FkbM family methyltransferase
MKQQILFDIGANHGKYADVHRNSFETLVLVEPNPVLANELREKYKEDASIHIVEAIASNKSEEIFYISNADTISTSDYDWVSQSRFTPNYQWIPVKGLKTVSLDTLIAQFGQPDLLKIDVEGYELNVIQSLSTKVKLLCFEWAEEKKIETLLSLQVLKGLGFSKFHIQDEDKYDYTVKDSDWVSFSEVCSYIEAKWVPDRKVLWGMIWAL